MAERLPLSRSLPLRVGSLHSRAPTAVSDRRRARLALPPGRRTSPPGPEARAGRREPRMSGSPVHPSTRPPVHPLLSVRNLVKNFPIKKGAFGKAAGVVRAVNDVSFDVMPGETLG